MKNLFKKELKENFVSNNGEIITVVATKNGWTATFPEGTTSYKNKEESPQFYMKHVKEFLGNIMSTNTAAE